MIAAGSISVSPFRRFMAFTLGACSIGSLLLYFFGIASFLILAAGLLTIEALGLAAWWMTADANGRHWMLKALQAGAWATFAYDIVRLPIIHSGVPVFKAISYFGTVMAGAQQPTPMSEVLGWAYHLSNGISFGLMYAALAPKPGPVSAVIWGLALEGAMLVTPYAEVFGYQRDARFLSITIGSHAVYGFTLWLGLRQWLRLELRWLGTAAAITVPLALGLLALDFNRLYAHKLPTSPPPYVGNNLYTTWNVPEPDRVVAIWAFRKFQQPQAQFHFIQPFEHVKIGRPFDLPEAEIRRHGLQSATEYVLNKTPELKDERLHRLEALARMTNLTEVSPWMLAANPEAGRLAERIRAMAETGCGRSLSSTCLPELLASLDRWYDEGLR